MTTEFRYGWMNRLINVAESEKRKRYYWIGWVVIGILAIKCYGIWKAALTE